MMDASRGQFLATVQANLPLCREHYRLVLSLPAFPETEPGQFVQIACRTLNGDLGVDRELDWPLSVPLGADGDDLRAPVAFLRRPFSLAGRRNRGGFVELDIIHRVVGVGTDWLSRLNAGASVGVLGPLGNRFKLPEANQTALLVGGGVGIPPMLYLAEKLVNRQAVAFCGALTRDLLPLTLHGESPSPDAAAPGLMVEEFTRHGVASVISTDDGSYGFRGFVTQALEQFLDSTGGEFVIYTCGPEPMMKRVADIAAARDIACQIAVERAMACGMGTCQSCCIRLKDAASPQGWRYRLACTDGPVFAGSELLW